MLDPIREQARIEPASKSGSAIKLESCQTIWVAEPTDRPLAMCSFAARIRTI